MKLILILVLLLSFECFGNNFYQVNYESSNYTIKITYCCEEGELDCDEVYYEGTSKKDNSYIQLKGRTVNNYSSHSFLGYQFQKNEFLYIIRDNVLSIYKGKKLLQKEELHENKE